jgi:hypothetical protein
MTPEPAKDRAHAGQHALELIRSIITTVETTPNFPQAMQISAALTELDSMIRGLQSTRDALGAENHDLKRQLKESADWNKTRRQFRYKLSVYWRYDNSGNRVDGPYCPNCLDEGRVQRLEPGAVEGVFRCSLHKALFFTRPSEPSRKP